MLHNSFRGFGQTSGEGGEIVEVDEDECAIFAKDGVTSIDGKARLLCHLRGGGVDSVESLLPHWRGYSQVLVVVVLFIPKFRESLQCVWLSIKEIRGHHSIEFDELSVYMLHE